MGAEPEKDAAGSDSKIFIEGEQQDHEQNPAFKSFLVIANSSRLHH